MEQHPFEETSEGRGRVALPPRTPGRDRRRRPGRQPRRQRRPRPSPRSAAKPKRGGTFRLGVTGGGAKDFIDGQSITTKPDQARLTSGWETLLSYDRNYKLGTDGLAEEATQDNAKQWTIRLKSGIEFNNGKTLSADDVIYSLRRIANPKNKLFGTRGPGQRRPRAASRRWTSSRSACTLKTADSTIGEQLGQYYNGIVPVGYSRTNKLKWVGTGPFITKSFSPGRQSVHDRNPNYWRTGQPYFDTVKVIDFADPAAQVNALFSGAIDAMTDIPFAQLATAKGHSNIKILESPGGGWLPLCMAVDMPPFDNVHVRKAMRLHRRPAGDAGAGALGPRARRERPLRAVRRRLRHGAAAAPPGHRSGQGAAQGRRHGEPDGRPAHDRRRGRHGRLGQRVRRAGEGGRRHDQRQERPELLRRPVPQAGVLGRLLGHAQLPRAGRARQHPGPPTTRCHWGLDGLEVPQPLQAGRGGARRRQAHELVIEMQKMEYNKGGYIIPFFNNLVDAYSSKVAGFQPSKGTLNLDAFGHGYRTIWFA